ncbi:MAG TPA: hypothetical protein DEA44_11375 [Firmicutes bacterium]|nr:hypothetical protein [Bacillota bacterium]
MTTGLIIAVLPVQDLLYVNGLLCSCGQAGIFLDNNKKIPIASNENRRYNIIEFVLVSLCWL